MSEIESHGRRPRERDRHERSSSDVGGFSKNRVEMIVARSWERPASQRFSAGLALRLLREKGRVDVGQDAAASDGDRAQELVQLLVVADGELDVAGHDARLLVVARGVARELEDLGAEVLEDGAYVHARGHGRARRPAAQVAREARARELESRLGRRRRAGRALGLTFAAATFSFARHD